MKVKIHPSYLAYEDKILKSISNFEKEGKLIYGGTRNSIKIFDIGDLVLNIKAFQKTNFIKKIIYTYFRASKAQRSYNYALKLIESNIGTPKPIAYIEKNDLIGLSNSYYVCEHLEFDLMFRELVTHSEWPEHEKILRAFTHFCFKLHEKGIEFKDHSPGNTLIKKSDDTYKFYLVDLNRMRFHKYMTLQQRMFNLRRLTPKLDMVSIIADEYAKLKGENSEKLFKMLWEATSKFQKKFHRKKRFKQKLNRRSS